VDTKPSFLNNQSTWFYAMPESVVLIENDCLTTKVNLVPF